MFAEKTISAGNFMLYIFFHKIDVTRSNLSMKPIKGHLLHKTIILQNVPSEAQVTNFFV